MIRKIERGDSRTRKTGGQEDKEDNRTRRTIGEGRQEDKENRRTRIEYPVVMTGKAEREPCTPHKAAGGHGR